MTRHPLFVSFTSLVLAILFAATLTGCGGKDKDGKTTKDGTPAKPDVQAKDAQVKDAQPKDTANIKDAQTKDATATTDKPSTDKPKIEPISLFDGKTMGNWQVTNFGGEGEVEIKDGQMTLYSGSPLSGVHWKGKAPLTMDYEISLEAQRVEGGDFFLCLTVPVKDAHISLVLGGWGGTLVGLSSIDGMDASENEYTQFMNFDQGKWYKVRLIVKEKQIQAFIDDKKVIDATTEDRRLSTRIEVELSQPLGMASFSTVAAYRNITMKKLE